MTSKKKKKMLLRLTQYISPWCTSITWINRARFFHDSIFFPLPALNFLLLFNTSDATLTPFVCRRCQTLSSCQLLTSRDTLRLNCQPDPSACYTSSLFLHRVTECDVHIFIPSLQVHYYVWAHKAGRRKLNKTRRTRLNSLLKGQLQLQSNEGSNISFVI